MREEIGGKVKAFLAGPIEVEPCLWIDAIYLKISRGDRIEDMARAEIICGDLG